jgi:hypothetical protein
LDRAHDLAEFRGEVSFCARLEQTSHLHREGRTAGDHPPLPQELGAGAGERQRVDPAMTLEPGILVRLQHGEEQRIDLVGFDRQPPAPVRGREGAQEPPLAVEHHGRTLARRPKIERAESLRKAQDKRGRAEPAERQGSGRDDRP